MLYNEKSVNNKMSVALPRPLPDEFAADIKKKLEQRDNTSEIESQMARWAR
jgi:hypothetical protein